MAYTLDKIKEVLGGKTPEEAGISSEDLKKLVSSIESGLDLSKIHLASYTKCACNICRT